LFRRADGSVLALPASGAGVAVVSLAPGTVGAVLRCFPLPASLAGCDVTSVKQSPGGHVITVTVEPETRDAGLRCGRGRRVRGARCRVQGAGCRVQGGGMFVSMGCLGRAGCVCGCMWACGL
jgi:hypothetical protein